MLTKFDENVMCDYVIVSDFAMDLPYNLEESSKIIRLSMKLMIEGKSFNGSDININDFYSKIRKRASVYTTQLNPSEFEEYFRNYFEQGKDIIYLCLSSKLSGMYSSACLAAKELMKKYPERRLEVIDTLGASLGIGHLAIEALKMRSEGIDIIEASKRINEMKHRIYYWFVVDDLYHLRRGGRISSNAALFGSMMNIKPILKIDSDGAIKIQESVRGRKKAYNALISKLQEYAHNKDMKNEMVYISHADCEEDAKFLAGEIKKAVNVKDVMVCPMTPVIGAHTGADTLALIFSEL